MAENGGKVRVLHVLPWVASGGVERRRRSLAKFLPRDRFEQHVFCLDTVGPLADDIRAHGVPVTAVGNAEISEPRVYWELAKLIRSFRPHIIHGAVFEGVRLATLMGRLMRVPVVLSEETSHATNRSWLGEKLFSAYVTASDGCVAISPAVADYLEEHSWVSRSKIVTISNGVPIPEPVSPDAVAAARAEFGVGDEAVLFITVGRLYDDTHKRVSDIIKAVASERFDVAGAKVLVVGEGPIRSDLEALAQELGVADRFVFTGYRHDVDTLYAASDVFVLASGREGFGLVVAEAMMHGLPTLTTRVGGIGDIVSEGETGVTFDVADVERLARLMTELANEPVRRQRLGRAGKIRAEQEFSSERYANDVAEMYESFVESMQL